MDAGQLRVWEEHFKNWVSITQPIIKLVPSSKKLKSLVFLRFFDVCHNVIWVGVCVFFGRYHSAVRELRYVLESMIQAYYVDCEHPEADLACKLEVVKEIDQEAFSCRVDGMEIPRKQEIKQLYHDLSIYVHSSYEELAPSIKRFSDASFSRQLLGQFDRNMFNKSVEATNRVMDVVYYVVFKRFPEIIGKVDNAEATTKSFRSCACEMTLDLLEHQN